MIHLPSIQPTAAGVAVVNNPSPNGQGGHYDAVAPAGNGAQAAASTSSSDNTSSSDRGTPPEETEATPAGDGDGTDNIQLRRYVAEVSASAEAVDQLQRSGNLDLAPVVAEAAQEWARDRDEEEDNGEEEAVEATEEVPVNGEDHITEASADCENIIESDKVNDKSDTDLIKLDCLKEEKNFQPSISTPEAQSHSESPCNLASSQTAETLQHIERSLETVEERRASTVPEELTSSDIQV